MESSIYLGTEKPGKLLLKFAVPCIFSLIISCLYNIVDQIFVGNGVGYLGNAATGVIFPVTVIGWGISLFFGGGSQRIPGKKRNRTHSPQRGQQHPLLLFGRCGAHSHQLHLGRRPPSVDWRD